MNTLFFVLTSVALWLVIMTDLLCGKAAPHEFGFSADIGVLRGGFKHKTNLQKLERDKTFETPVALIPLIQTTEANFRSRQLHSVAHHITVQWEVMVRLLLGEAMRSFINFPADKKL